MTKKIKCRLIAKNNNRNVRVRIIKAPVVNNNDLEMIIYARTRAIVL